jgi:hypothetical protein
MKRKIIKVIRLIMENKIFLIGNTHNMEKGNMINAIIGEARSATKKKNENLVFHGKFSEQIPFNEGELFISLAFMEISDLRKMCKELSL